MTAVAPNDRAYLRAVHDGDMETAARLVDRAARAAGYTGPWFHGGTVANRFGFGNPAEDYLYVSSDPDVAGGFADQFDCGEGRIVPLYVRANKVLDLTDKTEFERCVGPVSGPFLADERNMSSRSDFRSGGWAIDRVRDEGFDAIKFFDTDVCNRGATPTLLVFDPRQVKLAPRDFPQHIGPTWWGREVRDGTVVRDDSGAVIVLSRRFDSSSADLRGRIEPDAESFPGTRRESCVVPLSSRGRCR